MRHTLVFTAPYLHSPKSAEISGILNGCNDIEARNSVIFLDRLPSSDLPSLYKYAIATIVPTLFEGSCPFPILESLAMDTSVAIGRIEVTEEVIAEMDAFITFDPYSVCEIEKAIHDLWMHKTTLLPRQKLAISNVLQRKWSEVAGEYYSLIHQIMDSN
ncbi:glycosyltransferase [Paenibacillus sp. V4I7]|uniref:glycosyltransferase n=1 Tax=Paenibacillus sp. V4I7 TaxID=3042307 RepID=UPI00359398F0